MYTIILADGTELKNLKLNGNNYISDEIIDDSVFENNLDTVKITDGKTTKTFTNMRLMSNRKNNEHSWFILSEKTEQQKKEETIVRQIEFLQSILNVLLTGEV